MAAELLRPEKEGGSSEDEGMLRMSLMEHLEELRARIIKMLYGFGVVFVFCLYESEKLFEIVMAPGRDAMRRTGIPGADFVAIGIMENFQVMWVWTPLVASLFLSSPWILWQVWAFLSPGLYKREKKWAIPFVLGTSGLFLLGGAFGYFIAFRYGLEFLLGIGKSAHVLPLISIEDYFDRFVDMMLGIGVAFELPVLLFFLTLIRVASPGFLLSHSRYVIMAIVILAAIITPTPDAFNLMLFAAPMCVLFFIGIFLSYLLVLKREGRGFQWLSFLKWLAIAAALLASVAAVAAIQSHGHLSWHWPFLLKN
jgi:sec-independent protein translocase protein TatC